MTTTSLIDRLRRRVRDDRPNHKAMSISVVDEQASRAIIELYDGHLIVKVVGGNAPSIDFKLSDARYSTISSLYSALSLLEGYLVQLDEDASGGHLSSDIFPISPTNIGHGQSAVELRHFLFSDFELSEILGDAAVRHNPTAPLDTLPTSEEVFVLQLAHAEVCRRQAYNSSKRKGLSETVSDLLSVADSLERAYHEDIKRHARSIVSPKEAAPQTTNEGDIVIGSFYRRSPRTGYMSPIGQNLAPHIPNILEPDDLRDIEDTNIRVRWSRNNADQAFAAMEIWLDTIPDVMRGLNMSTPLEVGLDNTNRGLQRNTTSKMVYRTIGGSNNVRTSRAMYSETGQVIDEYSITELEPDTEYYVRIYVRDFNGEFSSSAIMRYKTKPLRVRFAQTNPFSAYAVNPGDVITINFDQNNGAITAQHEILFGGIKVTHSIVSNFVATIVVPNFVNRRLKKDIVVRSPPTLLSDIRTGLFEILSTVPVPVIPDGPSDDLSMTFSLANNSQYIAML